MSISSARALLDRAAAEPERIERHLLVAAALAEVLSNEPIVVGGLAEDLYTHDTYNPTDLDLVVHLVPADEPRLEELGFEQEGRHRYHAGARVAVEFPEGTLDGDVARTVTIDLGGARTRIIGVDDLYVDRLRQATMTERETDIAFKGALAIAAARFEELDWKYVRGRIREVARAEPMIGKSMAVLNRRVRARALKAMGL